MENSRRSAKAEFWKQVLEEHSESNLSVSDFCSQKSLSDQSFYQWKRKLTPRPSSCSSPSLIPVRIVPSAPAAVSRSIQVMTPSGYAIRFDSSLEPSQLANLIEAIESAKRGDAC